mmetsp:Transcript_12205/g.25735  ORF Transcript_12205/g.25735 Transcript_12205/m.25735 type:complete len:1004 (+) Transcript_12205:119-3130(+)
MKMKSNPFNLLLTFLAWCFAPSCTDAGYSPVCLPALATTASSTWALLFLPTFSQIVHADDEMYDRPQAVYKINIHADDSSDDSSDDDDESEDDDCLLRGPNGECQVTPNVQHFTNDFGQLEFKWSSCNDPYDDSHDDFEEVALEKSLYQTVIFEENLIKEDKCLRLDETLQQCSSYRPHYHEPFVHYSASYLNKDLMSGVKRVVFVGGGDSMLLHEILKYEELELVLGLELDQKVTRNSFEHFKTQPHFDNPKVQWWFGDGAKSLTLLPRSYFGTFDLVLLDLSETVMSMTVTKGLDVFGAMKLLLSPTGILVKNDYGYFEKLSKVFDTCLQLLIPDVTYICDYELVLCASDEVNFLDPKFDHLKQVETLVYKPLKNINDHWGPVTDFSKYWGEPRQCSVDENEHDDESVAYAGILMIVEAENISFSESDGNELIKAFKVPLERLGYHVITTTSQSSEKSGGVTIAIALKEGYVLAETWPTAKYCKLDIHLWGGFENLEAIRSELLEVLGSAEGDWSSFRIVTGGMRGVDTRESDLKTVGPDYSKIGQCEELSAGSGKAITLNASSHDEATLGGIINAALEEIPSVMLEKKNIKAAVFCREKGQLCRAKDVLEMQGYKHLVTLWSCSEEESKEIDTSAYHNGLALKKWREALSSDASEFSLCGKKSVVALKEIGAKIKGLNMVVVDALAPSVHVPGAHQYWLKHWRDIKKPFLMLVPILDPADQNRSFFLKSRWNHGEEDPEFYSEIYVGNGDKTMSFGLIHEGTSDSLQKLVECADKLSNREEVKVSDIRKVTIRGAMRNQVDYNPVTFSWADYDQRPGLEQYYGQRPIGLQTLFQLGLVSKTTELSRSNIKDVFKDTALKLGVTSPILEEKTGQGALYIAMSGAGEIVATWDGADSININLFTYDESVNHLEAISSFASSFSKMELRLRDEQPRGYGKVINRSDRVNFDESPDCYDFYKICPRLKANGNCEGTKGAKAWMSENCKFSCEICDKNSSFASEL